MTIAEACILVACLLPIVCAGIAKFKSFGKLRRDGGFDNNNPASGWPVCKAGRLERMPRK